MKEKVQMFIVKSSERVQLRGKDNLYKTKIELQRQLMDWVSQYPDLKIDNHENIRLDLLREKSGHCTLQLHLCVEDIEANRRYLNAKGIDYIAVGS